MAFSHNTVVIKKIVIKIFATLEKFNLPKYIENNILYNFKVVSDINFIEKLGIFDIVKVAYIEMNKTC